MAISDFTGQNIQDTYQRVVQTDGTNQLADGTGSIFIPVSASHAITASHALFAVSASHEITFELSSSHAVSADTASFATDFKISNDLTVNGNILLSNGSVIQNGDNNQPSITFGEDNLTLSSTQGEDVIINQGATIQGNATINGNISTTGDSTFGNASTDTHTFIGDQIISGALFISESTELGGNIFPQTPQGATLGTIDKPFSDLFLQSGSISIESDTPGNPSAIISNVNGNLEISVGGMLLVEPGNSFIAETGSFSFISGSMTQVGDYLQIGDKIIEGNLSASGFIKTDTHITASGNISASDNIFARSITVTNLTASIVSASDRVITNNITASGNISASGDLTANNVNAVTSLIAAGLNYPTTDGDRAETIITDGAGNLSFGLPEKLHLQVRNDDTVDIPAGTPIYSEGEIGGSERIKVRIAKASDATRMPAIGIVETTLTTGGGTKDGFAIINGIYNTNITPVSGTPNEGDTIYVHADGGVTTNKPSGSNLIQNIGTVLKEGGGQIQGMKVSSIDRTNDVPNLFEGQIFFGSGSDQAFQTHISGALDTTVINNITASGNISAGGELIGIINGGTF